MKHNYNKRLKSFIFLRLSTCKWFDSKHIRPILVKMGGVKIGRKAHIGANVTFDTIDAKCFDIGDNFVVTMNCVLLTHSINVDKNGKRTWHIGKLKVGDNVFIGAGSIITRPLTIGDNVVIGANSVITKDIPANCIVAGSPAKIIKHF